MGGSKSKDVRINMCSGPLFGKIVLFSLPLMVTFLLQQLFFIADLVVLGRFASGRAMAAVGACASLGALLINVFCGLSVGVNVVTAQCYGANDKEKMSKVVSTSAVIALIGGIGLAALGLCFAEFSLRLTNTPEDVMPGACNYFRIWCVGIPFIILYNFCMAVLRAVGDTKRPFYYLMASGSINVVLNLVFVLVCHMQIEGVALATVISHVVSAILVVNNLTHAKDACRLVLSKLRIDLKVLLEFCKIGLPAGVQSSCFSVSNIILQTSTNSFGSVIMAGHTAAMVLEAIIYICGSAYYQAAIAFVGQNYGADRPGRIIRSIWLCSLCGFTATLVIGGIMYIYAHPLISFFSHEEDIVEAGVVKLRILALTYTICSVLDVFNGSLRGLGRTLFPTIVTIAGVCVFRIVWASYVLPLHKTVFVLLVCYPLSWIITAIANGTYLRYMCKRLVDRKLYRKPAPPRALIIHKNAVMPR